MTCCQEAAAQHWCDNGVDEGRQATSSFHTKQYLDNYPDLAEVRYHIINKCRINFNRIFKVFGSDYRALVLHYLNNGLAEGRLGYKVGANHGYGRWTVRSGNHIITRLLIKKCRHHHLLNLTHYLQVCPRHRPPPHLRERVREDWGRYRQPRVAR